MDCVLDQPEAGWAGQGSGWGRGAEGPSAAIQWGAPPPASPSVLPGPWLPVRWLVMLPLYPGTACRVSFKNKTIFRRHRGNSWGGAQPVNRTGVGSSLRWQDTGRREGRAGGLGPGTVARETAWRTGWRGSRQGRREGGAWSRGVAVRPGPGTLQDSHGARSLLTEG